MTLAEMVRVDKEHGIRLIESSNLVGDEDLSGSFRAVMQMVQDTGFTKVMVDASALVSLPPLLHPHCFAKEIAEKTHGLKHAIILSVHSPKKIRHIETVAMNRGTQIHIFNTRADALQWLN